MLDTAFTPYLSARLPDEWKTLQRHIPDEWIANALAATGTATLRKRRLPAEQVVWIVIGMALLRDRSIDRVVASLDLALPGKNELTTKASIAQARERLGSDAMRMLFETTGRHWAFQSAEKHTWRGLSLFAYDGTTIPVPDSIQNRTEFGGQWTGNYGHSGYPSVRAVALLALRSHVFAALKIGPYSTGETELASELWKELPPKSLVIVDRGLMVAAHLIQLARSEDEQHWLARPRSKRTKWTSVKKLGRSEELVELQVPQKARERLPELGRKWLVRAIHYKVNGSKRTLLTSLLDTDAYPAAELVQLYRERWEQELAYDELKTHLLNREETIRSRTPEGVRQELYGIAIAYNLIRVEMERVADELKLPPTRISFVAAAQLVRDEWLWCSNSTPGAIPKQLNALSEKIKFYVLPERRVGRSYPRAVKVRSTKFPRKPLTTTAH